MYTNQYNCMKKWILIKNTSGKCVVKLIADGRYQRKLKIDEILTKREPLLRV